MKRTFIYLSLLVLGVVCLAQEPNWVNHLPKTDNNTFMYVREFAVGYTENDARNQALQRVFQSTAMRIGLPFDSEQVFKELQAGKGVEFISSTYNIPINKVCEYSLKMKNNQYKVYVLCQVAKAGNIVVRFEDFNQCDTRKQYNNSLALLSSVFIPGLGQINKRHYTEGVLTLSSEILLAGAGTYLYFQAQDRLDIMRKGNVSYKNFSNAKTDYDNFRKASYVVWSAFGVLYLFNLYRAFTLHPKYKESLAFTPVVLPDYNNDLCLGFNLSLKF